MDIDNLERAIAAALNPNIDIQTKSQATDYLNSIKNDKNSYKLLLNLLKNDSSSQNSLFFMHQVIEETLRNKILSEEEIQLIKNSLWEFLKSNRSQSQPTYLTTKLALNLVLVFKLTYLSKMWASFFDDIIGLTKSIGSATESIYFYNEFLLKVSFIIYEECVELLIAREKEELHKNTLIKDLMRLGDVQKLITYWFELMCANLENTEIVNEVVTLMGLYVSWVDIKLIVFPYFINLLYQFLNSETTRNSAIDCLTEIISKGMKPAEKLDLVQVLGVIDVVERFLPSAKSEKEEDSEFRELVAKFANALGIELGRCWEETDLVAVKEASFSFIQNLFPMFLNLLMDEIDDTSLLVFPFLNSYINLLKKITKSENLKQNNNSGKRSVPTSLVESYSSLLRVIIMKMKFHIDDESIFLKSDNDEDEAFFLEMRKNLKGFFESLASTDIQLFSSIVPQFVCTNFELFKTNKNIPWNEIELALYILHIYQEALKGVPQYVYASTSQLTPLSQMLFSMLSSNVSSYPHLSVCAQYFEVVVRYSSFFEINTQLIPEVLTTFIDERGLHSPNAALQARVFYLFFKFLKAFKGKLDPFIDNILNSIQDLLTVPLPSTGTLIEDGMSATRFDSLLYIFEAAGVLISEGGSEMKKVEYLTAVLSPNIAGIKNIMSNELYNLDTPPDNFLYTIHLSQLMISIGSVAKGFPTFNEGSNLNFDCIAVFKNALQCVLAVLERLSAVFIVRDAARFTYQRMVGCIGLDILPFLPILITSGLLSASSLKEICDFLNFISLIVHKFKPAILPVLDQLFLTLIERIFNILNQQPSGTDEMIACMELRKSYLNFLAAIFNNDLEDILTSDLNRPHLTMVMQSVIHCANDSGDPGSQKLAFSVLGKMITAWGGGIDASLLHNKAHKSKSGSDDKGQNKTPSSSPVLTPVVEPFMPNSRINESSNILKSQSTEKKKASLLKEKKKLDGFREFLYQHIIPLLFSLPRKLNLKDGSSLLILNEISILHRMVYFGSEGEFYIEFLQNFFKVENLNFESSLIFLDALRRMDGKEFRAYLTKFFSN